MNTSKSDMAYKVNKAVLKDAFAATCKKRGTDHLQEQAEEIIKIIEADTRHLDLSFQTISKRRQEHCAALIEHIRSAVTLLFWKPWR